jgi:hypothetical protein
VLEAARSSTHTAIASRGRIAAEDGQLQMQLFDEQLAEVMDVEDGVRYVLRRNPQRAAEVAAGRNDKVRPSRS